MTNQGTFMIHATESPNPFREVPIPPLPPVIPWRWQITDDEGPDHSAWSRFMVVGRSPGEAFNEAVRQYRRSKELPSDAVVRGFMAPDMPENVGEAVRFKIWFECKTQAEEVKPVETSDKQAAKEAAMAITRAQQVRHRVYGH